MLPASPVAPGPRSQRISLACAPCRSRHVRCDGTTPTCSRCRDLKIHCDYHKSRRGGRPRKVAAEAATESHSTIPAAVQPFSENGAVTQVSDDLSLSSFGTPATATNGSSQAGTSLESSRSTDESRAYLLDLFYANFHASQPCVLPLLRYEQKFQECPDELHGLDLVMQFIGSLFNSDATSPAHEDRVNEWLSSSSSRKSGYSVQALILYATAVYWRDDRPRAGQLLSNAIDQALEIGLHLRQFASANSAGDLVLAESWRRTWWQLYITDAHITAINHADNFKTSRENTVATVELPCEENEYLTGKIPPSRTLEEYDDREFATDCGNGFSSFAYLVGLVRSFDHTLLGHQRMTSAQSKSICINADCAVTSWLTLLPKAKRKIISEEGIVDEHIFKAMLMIPVYVVDIHRSLSNLKYESIESISTCSPPPPPENMAATYRREAPVHTCKILQNIETMIEILLIPTQMTVHTPFVICMISSTTIAYLSACKHVLSGERLYSARERIRVAMGALSSFAEVWPAGERILQEVKAIARQLLSLGNSPTLGQVSEICDANQSQPRRASNVLSGFEATADWNAFDEYMFADENTALSRDLLFSFSA